MLTTITPIRVFISSPGDLIPEREVVRAVLDELNDSPIFRDRFKVLPFAWEDGVPPAIGPHAQDTVDTYLLHPADADILICLLWLRMGSPQQRIDPDTGRPYQSGTEYEFLTAYRAHMARGRPLILLYRCQRPPHDGAALDREQTARVEAFFQRFLAGGDLQGLIGSFDHADSLRDKLRHDLSLLLQRDFAPPPPNRFGWPGPRSALPLAPTALVGREREMVELGKLLRRPNTRLLTLTGPGGIGKTRLALEIAAELFGETILPEAEFESGTKALGRSKGSQGFADGVWFVDLAPLSDPDLVISAISQALGRQEPTGQDSQEQLQAYLRDKQMLLVLDNFEQIVSAATRIAQLLSAAPELKVLVTSRTVLHLRGEKEYVVPPLARPNPQHLPSLEALSQYGAIALFVQRAQDIRLDFQLTQANARAVAEICERLDGLPLAIELAAARSRQFSPQALLGRLADRLKLLVGGPRDLPARQQTLRDTIDWSYNLLAPDERTLFRRLAVFAGGCTAEAAEAICNVASDLSINLLEGLASLVDSSLLRQEERSSSEPRFLMLGTIREYAFEQLAEHGELAGVQQHYAAYYLALAEAADLGLQSPQHNDWIVRLDDEYDNLRTTLEHSLLPGDSASSALQFAKALWRFWYMRGYVNEGRAWMVDGLMARVADDPTLLRATLLHGASLLAMSPSQYKRDSVQAEIRALRRTLADAPGVAEALGVLGILAVEQGNVERGRLLMEESLASARELGYTPVVARLLNNLAVIMRSQGEAEPAIALLEESLRICRDLHNQSGIGRVLANLGIVARALGDYDRAFKLLIEGLCISNDTGDTLNVLWNLHHLAIIAALQGQPARATQLFGAIDEPYKSVGLPRPSDEDASYSRILADIRSNLGEQAFAAAWAAGQALSLEQAIAASQEWLNQQERSVAAAEPPSV
jgi:predicted ATPase